MTDVKRLIESVGLIGSSTPSKTPPNFYRGGRGKFMAMAASRDAALQKKAQPISMEGGIKPSKVPFEADAPNNAELSARGAPNIESGKPPRKRLERWLSKSITTTVAAAMMISMIF